MAQYVYTIYLNQICIGPSKKCLLGQQIILDNKIIFYFLAGLTIMAPLNNSVMGNLSVCVMMPFGDGFHLLIRPNSIIILSPSWAGLERQQYIMLLCMISYSNCCAS